MEFVEHYIRKWKNHRRTLHM